jgi:hypothetical protein
MDLEARLPQFRGVHRAMQGPAASSFQLEDIHAQDRAEPLVVCANDDSPRLAELNLGQLQDGRRARKLHDLRAMGRSSDADALRPGIAGNDNAELASGRAVAESASVLVLDRSADAGAAAGRDPAGDARRRNEGGGYFLRSVAGLQLEIGRERLEVLTGDG